MTDKEQTTIKTFGNRLRVRVSGICIIEQKILLLHHEMPGPQKIFWAPPGGGMEYGSNASENLEREFLEETGLNVLVSDFLFVHEFLSPPLHAVELFFKVIPKNGNIIKGQDPEMKFNEQIIREVKLMSIDELKEIPDSQKHQSLQKINSFEDLLQMRGFYHTQD